MAIDVVGSCWGSVAEFYTHGLISMLIEMVRLNVHRNGILNVFISNALTIQIVNEIYQRNLLTTLLDVLQSNITSEKEAIELSLWARLAGKICVNQDVREKLFSIKIHSISFKNIAVFQ